jgi:hypothetical protein
MAIIIRKKLPAVVDAAIATIETPTKQKPIENADGIAAPTTLGDVLRLVQKNATGSTKTKLASWSAPSIR